MAMDAENPAFIKRWPTEIPLLVFVAICSIFLWILIAASIVGFFYALFIVILFIFFHAAFVAHIKGNGVRVSAEQFPDIYRSLQALSKKFGLKKTPEMYLIQAGGILNAMALRFVRTKMIVMYSDLLEACDDNESARDMILAHELGHICAGHLNFHLLLAPGMFVPFLGKALSRAREYTADRYGFAGAQNKEGALLGLTILSVGKKYAPQVSKNAMVNQISSLNTGWMKIGEWVSTHPLLVHRMKALDPSLGQGIRQSSWGTIKGILIILISLGLVVGFLVGYIEIVTNSLNNLTHHAH